VPLVQLHRLVLRAGRVVEELAAARLGAAPTTFADAADRRVDLVVEGCGVDVDDAVQELRGRSVMAERRSSSTRRYRPGDTHSRPTANHRHANARKVCRQTSPLFLRRA
jgi:hypothetical protein